MRRRRVEDKRQAEPSDRAELSDDEWRRVEPLLPPSWQRGMCGRPSRDHRTLLNGILWVLRTRAGWRDLPAPYGPWQTAYMRFRRWRAEGRLGEIIERLGLDLPGQHRCVRRLTDELPVREHSAKDETAKP